MKKQNKQYWEKEIRKNVIYDEAEAGSPWDIDDLVAYVDKQLTKEKEDDRREGVGRRLRDVERRQEELEERIDHLSAMLNI